MSLLIAVVTFYLVALACGFLAGCLLTILVAPLAFLSSLANRRPGTKVARERRYYSNGKLTGVRPD